MTSLSGFRKTFYDFLEGNKLPIYTEFKNEEVLSSEILIHGKRYQIWVEDKKNTAFIWDYKRKVAEISFQNLNELQRKIDGFTGISGDS